MEKERTMAITSINLNKPMTINEVINVAKKIGIDDVIQVSETSKFEYEVTFWQYPE